MIPQVLESWGKVWEKAGQSREQKHQRVLESFKTARLKEAGIETERRIQVRFYGLIFKEVNPKVKKDKIFALWG